MCNGLRKWRLGIVALTLLIVELLRASTCWACPFCQPTKTLCQEVVDAQAAVIAELSGGEPATDDEPGTSVFQVTHVLRDPGDRVRLKQQIEIVGASSLPKGSPFLLLAQRNEKAGAKTDWGTPRSLSEPTVRYLKAAPMPEVEITQRLPYFRDHLEHPDFLIANDAYAEFANARYEDIVRLKEKLPADKLRVWLYAAQTPAIRKGLYGLLHGLSGTADDVPRLEAEVLKRSGELRIGIDGMMAGYLLLTGEAGLTKLEVAKLQSAESDESETYSALQAIRFVWQYAPDRIGKDRLKTSVRLLVRRPSFAGLALRDLARWKDWSIRQQVSEMALNEKLPIDLRQTAVGYLLSCSQDVPSGDASVPLPEHVVESRETLSKLRQTRPEIITAVERGDQFRR